jgi:hypothetical protein
MNTLQSFIKKCAADFTGKTRTNGENFISCKNNVLTQDEIRELHGSDLLPDDYRYGIISQVFDRLNDYDIDSENTLDDIKCEIVDRLVDIYNHDLLKWLSSNLSRAELCNEALNQGYAQNDIYSIIACAQYIEIETIYNNIQSFLIDKMENTKISA